MPKGQSSARLKTAIPDKSSECQLEPTLIKVDPSALILVINDCENQAI